MQDVSSSMNDAKKDSEVKNEISKHDSQRTQKTKDRMKVTSERREQIAEEEEAKECERK